MINRLYKVMDYLVSAFPSLRKLETIGDAFVVVGITDTYDEETVFSDIVEFSLLVKEIVQLVPMDEDSNVRLRIGLHCGKVVGGLSGYLNPRFCIFGDAMNTAARMEATGEVIHKILNHCHIYELTSYTRLIKYMLVLIL